MRTVQALLEGIRRVNRAPVILACVFGVTLLTALPFAMVLRDAMESHLASSILAEQVSRGVNMQWWKEFFAQTGPLGRTFQPSIIGFAAVLDNLSVFADAEGRPSTVLWIGAVYLLLWLFLTGGVLDRYARARPARSYEFFTACGMYFVRFLRLAPIVAATYYVLFAVIHPVLFVRMFVELTNDESVERTAFLMRLGLYAVFGALLVLVSIIFDYAKVRAVVEDRRSMLGAVVAGARFARRNARAVVALYAVTGCLFVGLLLFYAAAAPGAAATGAGVWLGVGIGQVYLLGRLWIKLVFLASETALFQSRLAHTNYVAAAPAARPEPPIVENAV